MTNKNKEYLRSQNSPGNKMISSLTDSMQLSKMACSPLKNASHTMKEKIVRELCWKCKRNRVRL